MDEVLTKLTTWTGDTLPSLPDLGGEDAIHCDRAAILADERLPTIVAAVCDAWPGLDRRDDAISFVRDAIDAPNHFVLADVVDVVLESANALPDVADSIVRQLRNVAGEDGVRGDIALEAWTRLAIANWCPSLTLRGVLEERVGGFQGQHPDATQFLVRAIGAALDQWNDPGLADALEQLTRVDGVEADAAVELGMHSLAVAAGAGSLPEAITALSRSSQWLSFALDIDQRNDAQTFLLAIRSLLKYSKGVPVSESDVRELEEAVCHYQSGFVGLIPHWRQPRADSAATWLNLVYSLEDVASIANPGWYEPAKLIGAAAEVYSAHRSLELIVAPGTPRGSNAGQEELPTRQQGIAAIVQPQIEAGIASEGNAIALLGRWLELQTHLESKPAQTKVDAVVELRQHLLERETAPPKAQSASVGLPDEVREALNLNNLQSTIVNSAIESAPLLVDVLKEIVAEKWPLDTTQSQILRRLMLAAERTVDGGLDGYRAEASTILTHLVRFTAFHLDHGHSGERGIAWWNKLENGNFPAEHVLAEELNRWLYSANLHSYVEMPNVAGGRVDIIVQFARCRIAIEVKRELVERSKEQLTDQYGAQAVQYASTDIAVAFLAVLDFSPRTTRIDLDGVLWTTEVQLDPSSRRYALMSTRIQANVQPPSAASKLRGAVGTSTTKE